MLVDPRELLAVAQQGGYAIPAFNVHGLDMVPPLVEVAEAERAPLILQATRSTVEATGWEPLVAVALECARRARVPVALHLDHASDRQLIYTAIRHGFTSVMADGSALPFDDNVAFTRSVVEVAHLAGIPVEGELGYVPRPATAMAQDPEAAGEGPPADLLIRPDEAEAFVAETGVDSLAVAIGTVHGFYRGTPRLDFERLAAIRARVHVPLVLHGGSGLADEHLAKAIVLGMAKVNVATELKAAWSQAVRQAVAENDDIDPRHVLRAARRALQTVAVAWLRRCGAVGRAT
ncbi:ketose-bisphosphate aldolase [Thermaerobacter marianensis DSM 12885]|uniref:Ketose-bisphosphate aldolase n=1 Tax=Thermaerobacter marianensis (strain ATCC 700841 / DSM 12885 / JCM 10246 / 7p75a) TaxID=644966 RepID=E6SI65_THEM7|nr:class II fructose-bisphosphate aldolase [Thermaerobacter marianensis]ADU50843.1 ketose-bisphosphate aldolase [Thermaerobacter marianensis DSM 12885]